MPGEVSGPFDLDPGFLRLDDVSRLPLISRQSPRKRRVSSGIPCDTYAARPCPLHLHSDQLVTLGTTTEHPTECVLVHYISDAVWHLPRIALVVHVFHDTVIAQG